MSDTIEILDPRALVDEDAVSETFSLGASLAGKVVGLRLDQSWRSYEIVWTYGSGSSSPRAPSPVSSSPVSGSATKASAPVPIWRSGPGSSTSASWVSATEVRARRGVSATPCW
jgi:hypothetical protein